MRIVWWLRILPVISIAATALAGAAYAAPRSAYYYNIHKTSDAEWGDRLRQWRSAGISQVSVSLEAGPKFLLHDPSGARRLAEMFATAVESGVAIEALILQDPSWAFRPDAARARLVEVLDFAREYPGVLESVQIDVEVYTLPEFPGGAGAWKDFVALVLALRQEIDNRCALLRFRAAVPWWLVHEMTNDELRQSVAALDGMMLMAYGEPGGTPVAAEIEAFRRKVHPAITRLAAPGLELSVGVAKYEHASASDMLAFTDQLDALLAPVPGYAGTALFDGAN